MAPPRWTPLPMLAMTVKHHKSVPNTRNKDSGTHPIDIHPPSLFRFLSLLQHLEQISTDAAQKKKNRQLPVLCPLLPSSLGFLLLCLPFPLDALAGCSHLRLSRLFDPRLLSCHLAWDLFKILLRIR